MKFRWLDGNNINQNISLPQFDLSVKLGDDYATDYYELAYPGVIMRIILRRKMSFHLWQTYLPSSIFVIVAWMSALVPPEQVPGNNLITHTYFACNFANDFRSRDNDDYDAAYLNCHVWCRTFKRPQSFLHLTTGRLDVCLYCLCLFGDHSLCSSDFFATLQPKIYCGDTRILWYRWNTVPLPNIQCGLLVHPRQHMVAPEPRLILT